MVTLFQSYIYSVPEEMAQIFEGEQPDAVDQMIETSPDSPLDFSDKM